MASVKRGNVPPTHPTVWVGLALAAAGLLLAVFAYTGGRVYDITYAFVALAGAILALAGILTAAWGRSILSARASRSRRAAISADALAMTRSAPASTPRPQEVGSEDAPTVAAPAEKKRFAFPMPRRSKKERAEPAREEPAIPAGLFAFRRPASPPPAAEPAPEAPSEAAHRPEPEIALDAPSEPVRVTLRCPGCSATFSAEGVRPFEATCGSCGFSATV